ncbi:MAG: ribosomal protein S18-alanine N-acetyltransferase [Catonella sp.]|uniref:ribosomal protein S18-alanine N-acetyltransferase n=1 Tax=Catonella sp. TaxID=2382125 RepID=UPI003FA053EB
MDDIEIVELSDEYCSQVTEIEKKVFSMPWSEKAFFECINNPGRHYFCAVRNGEVLGYCGYWSVSDEAEIYNVAVKEEARGKGIGQRLLKELIEYGKSDGRRKFLLEVRYGNETAISLYKKLGFKEDGIRSGFYDEPKEDALLMSLEIEDE